MAAPTSVFSRKFCKKIRNWLAVHPYLALTLAVLAALGPFLAKPFNIDDPLFIWVAHQIQAHPGDPFGFNVNWYGMVAPMWIATENPPLASYYIALAAAVLGWSEMALHFAFLLPALAVVLGTYRLARRFCDWPALAALATLVAPVFLVSSTTVMCDVMMLAFWVWAVVLWVEGMERENFRQLSLAGLLIALAVLTKFFGVCLIPLLAAYSLIEKCRPGRWTACLLIPLSVPCAYQWITRALYGRALLTNAMDYAGYARGVVGNSKIVTGLTALTFTGGCLAVVVFFMPLLWRTRALMMFAASAVLVAAAVYFEGGMLQTDGPLAGASRAFAETQIIFWAVGGVSVLALAVTDILKRRDAAFIAARAVGLRNFFVRRIFQLDGQWPFHFADGAGRGHFTGPTPGTKSSGGTRNLDARRGPVSGRQCGARLLCRTVGFSACHRRPPERAGRLSPNTVATVRLSGIRDTGDFNTTWI